MANKYPDNTELFKQLYCMITSQPHTALVRSEADGSNVWLKR